MSLYGWPYKIILRRRWKPQTLEFSVPTNLLVVSSTNSKALTLFSPTNQRDIVIANGDSSRNSDQAMETLKLNFENDFVEKVWHWSKFENFIGFAKG